MSPIPKNIYFSVPYFTYLNSEFTHLHLLNFCVGISGHFAGKYGRKQNRVFFYWNSMWKWAPKIELILYLRLYI